MDLVTSSRAAYTPDPRVAHNPWRSDFPMFQEQEGYQPPVYWDSAATTQKPQVVIDRLVHYYQFENANVHRGVYRLSADISSAYEQARQAVARFFHAASPEEVVFVKGTTEGINLVAEMFLMPRLQPGDAVVITHLEHHANILPWQRCCQKVGAQLQVIPIDPQGNVDLEAAEQLLGTGRVRMLAISHVASATGTRLPIEALVEAAHARDIPVLVDGAQAVSREPVNWQALGADFYVFSGHKLYGPTGVGVVYGRKVHWEQMAPYQVGGGMIQSVDWDHTVYAVPPTRFEAGTPPIAAVVGLHAAIGYLEKIGWDLIQAHEQALLAEIGSILSQFPAIRLIGEPHMRSGLYSFLWEGIHPHDVGTVLDQHGVAVRVGHHCAMPLMRWYQIPGTIRVSVGLYNNGADLRALEQACHAVASLWGHAQ